MLDTVHFLPMKLSTMKNITTNVHTERIWNWRFDYHIEANVTTQRGITDKQKYKARFDPHER